MALLHSGLGKCKRCEKFDTFNFLNDKQINDYCSICIPVVDQENINKSVNILLNKGITPEMYKRLYNEIKKK